MRNMVTVMLAAAASFCLAPGLASAQEKPDLNEHLDVLRPLLGSWAGEFTNAPEGQKLIDSVTFVVILNGNAIRSVHEVTGGYGGETIYYWNPTTQTIDFYYFTNIGQYAQGTARMEGNTLNVSAVHYGGAVSGWTAVATIIDENAFSSSARYYQSGEWTEGHAVLYKRIR